MLLSLLLGFSAHAGTFASSLLSNKITSPIPCVSIDCLNLREDDTEHIFPPDFLALTGLSGNAEVFDVEGSLLGYPVSLEATMLESDQSVAAYGTIDIANNGTTEYIGIYLDYVSANTWNVTAYVYTAATGTPVYSGRINGQLVYASWGNSTNPVNGWELRNASSTLYRSRTTSYSATYIPMSFDALIGDNVYYSSSVAQSSGTNLVTEYLYQSAGGAHYSGFYRSASAGLISASSSDQAFNMGGSSGNVTWFRSLAGSVVSLGMTEDLYQPTTRTTTTTSITTTSASVTTKVYNYVTALTTLYNTYTYGSLLGTHTAPPSYTGTGTSLLTPLD